MDVNHEYYFADLVDSKKQLPSNFPTSELEKTLNQSFFPSRRGLVDGFLDADSPNFPQNLWFCILTYEKGTNSGPIGATVVQREGIRSDYAKDQWFTFKYLDKLGVISHKQKNGAGRMIIERANAVYFKNEGKIPMALRTSEPEKHKYYSGKSDIPLEIISKDGTKYYVHGFGFRDKGTKEDLFNNASKIFEKEVAPYIIAMPQTIVKLQEICCIS